MNKRLYKFSPDYKLKFSRILNALGYQRLPKVAGFSRSMRIQVGLECGNAFMNLNFTLAWNLGLSACTR